MRALILVDLQRDFMPGGALGVPKGEEIIPIVNRLQTVFPLVVATKDWHPQDHLSFAENHEGKKVGDIVVILDIAQILWPTHCVENTSGAEFAHGLDTEQIEKVFFKGTDRLIDSYSVFFDNARRRSTGLHEYLQSISCDELFFAGLATDYCVFYSAMDARDLGYKTYVIEDVCKGIDLHPGDVKKAMQLMKERGIIVLSSDQLLKT